MGVQNASSDPVIIKLLIILFIIKVIYLREGELVVSHTVHWLQC